MSNAIETAKFLRRYQSWRKGEIDVFYPDSHAGPNPVEISAAIDRAIAALEAQPPCGADGAVTFALDYYDAGLLGDGGGGNVEWWQDYMRSELSRAHDCYQSQIDANHQPAAPVAPATVAVPVPDGVVVAFGLLWHVRMGCDFPVPQGFSKNISPEEAAAKARRFLSDLLTQEQKGDGINRASELLAASQREGGGT